MPLTADERVTLKSKLVSIDRSLEDSYDEEVNVQRNLPTEIITHIMSFVVMPCHPAVAFKAVNALSHICYRWRQAVQYEPPFWTHITM
ncbi:hypothetical protein FRB90_012854 [Tulasnella sp. 427]|nr:hypothetical protein FRB90_012854 [Tulasnella sp. 427]